PRPDRGLGDLELGCDLLVRHPLPLAHQDGAALVRRELGQRVGDALELVVRALRRRRLLADEAVVGDDLDAAAPPRRPEPLAADVRGDCEHPRGLGAGHGALVQAAVGVQEGGLDGILGLLRRRETRAAEAVDLAGVALEEELGARAGCRCGTHDWAIGCSKVVLDEVCLTKDRTQGPSLANLRASGRESSAWRTASLPFRAEPTIS